MALSLAIFFGVGKIFNVKPFFHRVRFHKKDIMLAAGCALVGAGSAVYLPPALAVAVAAGIFFIIKAFSAKSSAVLLNAAKGGLCVQCGQKADECTCEP